MPWLVIPAVGAVAGLFAAIVGQAPVVAIAAALLGAALAASIRAFVGSIDAPAEPVIPAIAGALLGVLGWLELGGAPRAAFAGAAAMFAICELARSSVPLPAVGAALVAGVLDPAYAALFAIAGLRLAVARGSRSTIALPIAGVGFAIVAVLAAIAHHGVLARLGVAWSGHARVGAPPLEVVLRGGDLIGPLASVAGLAGLAWCVARGRFAGAAVAGCIAFAALESVTGGGVGAALPIVAGFGAGVALGRFAALIRLPIGRVLIGAAAGFVVVAVPAWTVVTG